MSNTYAYKHIHILTCWYEHIYKDIHMQCMYIYIYIYVYICTYIHAHIQNKKIRVYMCTDSYKHIWNVDMYGSRYIYAQLYIN